MKNPLTYLLPRTHLENAGLSLLRKGVNSRIGRLADGFRGVNPPSSAGRLVRRNDVEGRAGLRKNVFSIELRQARKISDHQSPQVTAFMS